MENRINLLILTVPVMIGMFSNTEGGVVAGALAKAVGTGVHRAKEG